MKPEEIEAVYVADRFRWENDDGPATIIGTCREPQDDPLAEHFDVKGPDGMKQGLPYRLFGRWTTYRDRKQFHYQSFVSVVPHDKGGVVAYLKLGPQIGDRRAELLWNAFGSDAVSVVRERPEEAEVACGLKTGSFEDAQRWFIDHKRLEDCTIDITNLLAGRGFPRRVVGLAITEWGNRAAEIIRRNPYILMNFRGCGFQKTDKMYADLGLPLDSLKRQALMAWYATASDTEGNTWIPCGFLESAIRQSFPGRNSARAISLARRLGKRNSDGFGAIATCRIDQGEVVDSGGELMVAEGRRARHEQIIASCLASALGEPRPSSPEIEDDRLLPPQAEAANTILSSQIAILGGAPGTGKTFTAAAVIKQLLQQYGDVAIAAPTGKAAVRITEAMSEHRLGLRARTVHSLLQVDVESRGGWKFKHNARNHLPYKCIVIDEFSMMDSGLFSSLIQARSHGTKLILVGDVHQLPPVGHGAPLRDMIRSGMIPYAELTEPQRNAGAIVHGCLAIRKKQLPLFPADGNLSLAECSSPKDQVRLMVEFLHEHSPAVDPVWQSQVICAVNKNGPMPRVKLNKILQSEFCGAPGKEGYPFRLTDKIVCNKNGSYKLLESASHDPDILPDMDGNVFCANGEVGKVVDLVDGVIVVEIESPHKTVIVRKGKSSEEFPSGCDWDLAYAISCHKSQGSEYPHCQVILDNYPGAKRVCSREWIYTAISRAKKHCNLIGSRDTLEGMIRRTAINKRTTLLVEQLKREMA